jgi:TonB-dependent starch-binding outer membrane protein SusC
MRQFLLLILLFAGLLTASAQEQSGIVSGKILDAENGEGLPGVAILVKGTASQGTVTDLEGNFRLSGVSPSNVLVISFIGYKSQDFSGSINQHQRDHVNGS